MIRNSSERVLPAARAGLHGPVVQVVPYFPPHLGGMEVVAKSIAERLAEQGPVEVLTATTGRAGAPRVERRGNLVVRRLFTLEIEHVPFMPTLLVHLLRAPRSAIVHVHIAQAYVPEMVWLSCVIRRRPYVAHFHLDCDPTGRFGMLFLAYKRWILGPVLRSATRVIVLSQDQARFVERRYGVSSDRIATLPNGVGSEFFQQPRTRVRRAGPFRLLFVGRLSPQKNVSRLLRAMAELKRPVELVVVGDGEQRSMLERLCRQLGLGNVRMIGARMGTELVDWYRWADAFVLPSDKEGMPLALLEAMAAGLPIVGTNVPGIRDTVGDAAVLAAPDPLALAEAVDSVVADEDLWADLARRSSARAEHFSWTTRLEHLMDIYESVDWRPGT